eukprot:SAG31_NODE_4844_length_2910_cov_1.221985_2_plen_220_part_00
MRRLLGTFALVWGFVFVLVWKASPLLQAATRRRLKVLKRAKTAESDEWARLVAACKSGSEQVRLTFASATAWSAQRATSHRATKIGLEQEVAQALSSGGAALLTAERLPGGFTPLHVAVLHQHAQVAELLIANGADVGSRAGPGRTALHFAAAAGNCELVQLLTRNGADLNAAAAYDGYTALHCAMADGHMECANLLVQLGADEDALSTLGERPADVRR